MSAPTPEMVRVRPAPEVGDMTLWEEHRRALRSP